MNNDLISRSYLKNLPFERVIHTDFGETAIPIEEIDNAPTVELDESVIQEILNKRCMTAVANEYLVALHGTRPQGEFVEKLNERIAKSVCKYCQMNKKCELCVISRVFQIITLTAEEQKGGAE